MKVRVKEWLELVETYGIDEDGNINCRYLYEDGDITCYCRFTSEMKEYCGEVIDIDDDEVLICDNGNDFMYHGWFFSEDMYEVIEE